MRPPVLVIPGIRLADRGDIHVYKYPAYREYRERVPLYVPRISSLRRLIRAGIAAEDREKDE